MAKVIIVDRQDHQIGIKERDQLSSSDIYRVTGLWVTNSEGDILLAQRAFTKKHGPGKWGPAVAGTVEVGETYDSNIRKEVQEELGFNDVDIKTEQKVFVARDHTFFCQWYSAITNVSAKNIRIDPDEVAAIRWFTFSQLKQEVAKHPDNFLHYVHEFISRPHS